MAEAPGVVSKEVNMQAKGCKHKQPPAKKRGGGKVPVVWEESIWYRVLCTSRAFAKEGSSTPVILTQRLKKGKLGLGE